MLREQSIAICDIYLPDLSHYANKSGVKEIEFTSAAVRQWRKLTASTRAQIDLKLQAFARTGAGDVKALKGAQACGSAPVIGGCSSR